MGNIEFLRTLESQKKLYDLMTDVERQAVYERYLKDQKAIDIAQLEARKKEIQDKIDALSAVKPIGVTPVEEPI